MGRRSGLPPPSAPRGLWVSRGRGLADSSAQAQAASGPKERQTVFPGLPPPSPAHGTCGGGSNGDFSPSSSRIENQGLRRANIASLHHSHHHPPKRPREVTTETARNAELGLGVRQTNWLRSVSRGERKASSSKLGLEAPAPGGCPPKQWRAAPRGVDGAWQAPRSEPRTLSLHFRQRAKPHPQW